MKAKTILKKVLVPLFIVTLLSVGMINETVKVSAGTDKTKTDERSY